MTPQKHIRQLAFSALLACTICAGAQSTNTPTTHQRQAGSSGGLRNSLSLTDEQTKNLEPFFKEQQAKMSAMRTNTSLSRQERMAAIKDMRKSADEKMKAHLTPEQLQKMQQTRQQSTQFARPGGPKDHPSAPTPESGRDPRAQSQPAHASSVADTNCPPAGPNKPQ